MVNVRKFLVAASVAIDARLARLAIPRKPTVSLSRPLSRGPVAAKVKMAPTSSPRKDLAPFARPSCVKAKAPVRVF